MKDVVLKEVIKFLDKEYNSTKEYLERGSVCSTPTEIVHATIHSCLGVVMFAQNLGIEFTDVNPHYEKTLEKLRKLLDN